MITGKMNWEKPLTKHISFECKCKFDGKNAIQTKSWIMKSVDVSVILLQLVPKMVST